MCITILNTFQLYRTGFKKSYIIGHCKDDKKCNRFRPSAYTSDT